MAGWMAETGPGAGFASEEAAANLGPMYQKPGLFKGSLEAGGKGVMRGGALAAQSLSLAGSIVPRTADMLVGNDNLTGKSLTDRWFEASDETIRGAIDYWTPDARTTGKAAQVLGAVSEFAVPLLAGGGNPLATTITTTAQTVTTQGADLVRAGASAEEAGGVAAVQGLANLAGAGIATRGATALQRAAFGAGANVVVNMPADAASAAILEANPELAQRYDPFNVEARAADLIVGALFGAMTKGPVKTADLDPALVQRQAAHAQYDAAPGKITSTAEARAHMTALETAQADLLAGRVPEVELRTLAPDPVKLQQADQLRVALDDEAGQMRMLFDDEPLPRETPPDASLRQSVLDAADDMPDTVRRIVEENPDLPLARVVDDTQPADGQNVKYQTAKEAMEEMELEVRQADELSRGYEAAINCFLGGGI